MIFELLHAPYPVGYCDAILDLEACREHLRVDDDADDDLIAALRDASIEFVERYCEIRLLSTEGIEWRAEGFPNNRPISLSVSPVTAITAITWRNGSGNAVTGTPGDYRLTAKGDVSPAIAGQWPSGVGGDVVIQFTAGYAEGEAPPSLLAAVRMFLGHLYKNREAVTDRGTEGEVPFGVRQICAPFRRVII
jgi:uncharacterized phiE125 gp8 family phage protein